MRSWFGTTHDLATWQAEHGYSPSAELQLQRARRVIVCAARRLDAYAVAFQLVAPLLASPLSLRQRMRAAYLAALCFAALEEHAAALSCLGDVRELALRLEEADAQADGDYLAGAMYQRQGRYAAAAEAFEQALAALRQRPATSDAPRDVAFELSLLAACGIAKFLIGHYDSAARYVGIAEELLPVAPECFHEAALIAWVTAQLQRWRGVPEAAYCQARRALSLLETRDDPGAQGRIRTVLAEISLDMTQRLGGADLPSEIFRQARLHAQQALTYAIQVDDQNGGGLARLALARWSRLAHRNENRVAQIEEVLHLARELHDSPLLAQAYTALGDEFTTADEHDSARRSYQQALDTLEDCDAVAVGVWAQRALRWEQEWRR